MTKLGEFVSGYESSHSGAENNNLLSRASGDYCCCGTDQVRSYQTGACYGNCAASEELSSIDRQVIVFLFSTWALV